LRQRTLGEPDTFFPRLRIEKQEATMMHPTRNNLPQETRAKVIPILASLLADSADLYSQCKQAHWNVRGEGFIAVHELFDKVSAEVNEATDMIAERMQQLGSSVSGTVRASASQSRLEEYPLEAIGTTNQHVDALSRVLSTFNTSLLKAVEETDEVGDIVTSDMLTTIVRGLDKQLWFVESYLAVSTTEAQKQAPVQTKLTSVRH
jgi:starvation-inducible DNA-binding protein